MAVGQLEKVERVGSRSFSERELMVPLLLFQHRLLSTEQLHGLINPKCDVGYIRRLIRPFNKEGLVSFVHARERGAKKIWFLTAEGAQAVRSSGGCVDDDRPYTVNALTAAGLRQAHTLAVNDVGLSFHLAAREKGSHECGPFAWRHEVAHETANKERVQADSLLRYISRSGAFSFFIELDRASTPVEELVSKLRRYSSFYGHMSAGSLFSDSEPVWKGHYQVFPQLLIVFKDGVRGGGEDGVERRMRIVEQLAEKDSQVRGAIGGGMHVGFCKFTDLVDNGPFGLSVRKLGEGVVVNAFGEAHV